MERLSIKSLATACYNLPRMQALLLEKAVYSSAFDLVQNRANAKGPIDAAVHADMCEFEPEVIVRAVEFFTATTPTVEEKGGYYLVKSKGYRAGPAGDH